MRSPHLLCLLATASCLVWTSRAQEVDGPGFHNAEWGDIGDLHPAAEAPAAELSFEDEQEKVDRCIALVQSAGPICSTESDTMSLEYPRYSEELPTQQQEEAALASLKSTGQPSQGCCRALRPFADERCPCFGPFQDVLPIGGFSPAYFIGSTAILATACEFEFELC